jgi:hypothetical protein
MRKTPTKAGWIWVKEAFALFYKQPAEIVTLFLGYVFLTLILNAIPLLGRFLPLVLTPIFGMAFMKACIHIEQGRPVHPNLLLVGFRSPALKKLLVLGALHLAVAFIAISISTIVDNTILWNLLTSQTSLAFDTKGTHESSISLAILFSVAAYVPAAMAFWYAAPLIMWKNMGVSKAVFYSFFGVLREIRAFGLYALIWIAIGLVLPSIIGNIIAWLMGSTLATVMVLLPISVTLTVVMHCSFYTTYVYMFGRPDANLP